MMKMDRLEYVCVKSLRVYAYNVNVLITIEC